MKSLKEYLTESRDYEFSLEKWDNYMRSLGYEHDPKYDVTVMSNSWFQHRYYVNSNGEYYKIVVYLKKGVKPFEPLDYFNTSFNIYTGKNIEERAWGSEYVKIDIRRKEWKNLLK